MIKISVVGLGFMGQNHLRVLSEIKNIEIDYLFDKLDGHLVQSSQTEKELHQIIKSPIYEKCFHPISFDD